MSVGVCTKHTRIPTCPWTIVQTCTYTHVCNGACVHMCAYTGSCVYEVDVHVTTCVIVLVCVGKLRCVHAPVCVCVWLVCVEGIGV